MLLTTGWQQGGARCDERAAAQCSAQALGARVIGDEGEEYGTDGEMAGATEAIEEEASPGMKQAKRPWWKIF
mgnify:CR=1 FL=1